MYVYFAIVKITYLYYTIVFVINLTFIFALNSVFWKIDSIFSILECLTFLLYIQNLKQASSKKQNVF